MNPSHMYSMWPNGQRNINSPSPFQSAANYSNPTNRLQAVMNAAAAGNPYNQMVASYAPSPYDRSNTLSRNPAMDYTAMQKIPNQFPTGSFYNTTAAATHNPYDIYRQNSAVTAPSFSDLNRTNGSLMTKDPLSTHSASAYSNLFSQGFGSTGTEPLLSGLTARDYSSLSLNPAISQDVVSSVFESSLISQHGQQPQHQQQQQHLQQAAHAQQQQPQQAQQQTVHQQLSSQSSAQSVAQQQQQHQRAAVAAAAVAHLELQQQQQQPSPLPQPASTQPTGNMRRNSQGASNQHIDKNRHTSDPYSCQQQNKVPQAPSQAQKQVQQQQPQAQQQQQSQSQQPPPPPTMQNPPSVPSHAPGSVDAIAQSPRQPQSIASYHSPPEHTPQTPKTPRVLTFSDELRHLATIIEKCGSPSQAPDFTSRALDVVAIIDKLNKYTGITKISSETQTANSADDELFAVDADVKEFCKTVPRELVIRASKAPQGGIRLGVWGREEIPSASEFGPFKGRLCQSGTIVPDTADDHWLVRSLRSSNTYYFLPDSSNPPPRWMMFINSGYSEQGIEPNCFLLFQSENEYIIRVMCSIQPETEVLICVNEDLLPNHLLVSPIVEAPKEKVISPNAACKRTLPPIMVQEHNPESDADNIADNLSDQAAETDSEQLTTPVKVKSKSKKKRKGGKKNSASENASPVICKEVTKTIYFEDIPFYITHYACRDCKKYFLECSAYETHRKSYHEDNLPWRCKLCDAIGYKELGKLKSHYKKEHDKEDKILYFDKCRNEAIELSYQVNFEQDLSEFVEYELFSGARKLKSKRKLCEKSESVADEDSKFASSTATYVEDNVPDKKRARYESESEQQAIVPEVDEMLESAPENQELENREEETQPQEDENEMIEEKPKHSKHRKGSSKKDKSGTSKSKKKRCGKKANTSKLSTTSSTSEIVTRKTSPRRTAAHRQSEIEISIENDDGSEIKMKFDADDDDYMNDEEFMKNLQLTTSTDSDPDFGSPPPAALSINSKKKRKSGKVKKGRKRAASGVSPKVVHEEPNDVGEEEEPELEQELELEVKAAHQVQESLTPTVQQPSTRASKGPKPPKGRPRKEVSVSPAASKIRASKDTTSKENYTNNFKTSPRATKGRGRSKTPTKSGHGDEDNGQVDEKVIADILAAENKKFPSEKADGGRKSKMKAQSDAANQDNEQVQFKADISNAVKMSPDIKKKPEKKFECNLCLDKFIMVAKFERHMIEVHKIEKPWKCESCDMSFKRYFLMSQHMKIRHADDDEEDEGQVSSQSDRLSENDVSGIDQSENDEVETEEQQSGNSVINKPLAHYNPLDHMKQKHSNNILPPPVLSSKSNQLTLKTEQNMVSNLEEKQVAKLSLQKQLPPAYQQSKTEEAKLEPVSESIEEHIENITENQNPKSTSELAPSLNNVAAVEPTDRETSLALESIAEFSSEQVILQGDFGNKDTNKAASFIRNPTEGNDIPDSRGGGKDKKRKSKAVRTFICEYCDPPVEFNQASKWSRHLAEKHEIKKPFKCELCVKNFSSQQALDNHQKKCGSNGENSALDAANSALRCNKCNIEIKSMKLYTLHMSGDHSASVPYLCQLCTYQFPRASNLAEHLRSSHSVIVKESQLIPLTCSPIRPHEPDKASSPVVNMDPLENKGFLETSQSPVNVPEQLHITPVKKKAKSLQPRDGKSIEDNSTMQQNVGAELTTAETLQPSSTTLAAQELHASSVEAIPSTAQDSENKTNLNTVSVLTSCQSKMVMPQQQLSEAQMTTSAIVADMQLLNGDRKSKQTQCQICLKWMDRNYFQDHMNLHNGNKPYECDICKQRFAQRAGLAYHKRNHHSNSSSAANVSMPTTNVSTLTVATSLVTNSSVVAGSQNSTTITVTTAPTISAAQKPALLPATSSPENTPKIPILTSPATISQNIPLMEINGQTIVATTAIAKSAVSSQTPILPKPMAPTPTKAMEMILHKNRTILPASAKPTAGSTATAGSKNQQHSAIIIPASSAVKTATFQLAPSVDGKQTPATNFILTPLPAGKPSTASEPTVKPSTVKPIAPKKQTRPSSNSGTTPKKTNSSKKTMSSAGTVNTSSVTLHTDAIEAALQCAETLVTSVSTEQVPTSIATITALKSGLTTQNITLPDSSTSITTSNSLQQMAAPFSSVDSSSAPKTSSNAQTHVQKSKVSAEHPGSELRPENSENDTT